MIRRAVESVFAACLGLPDMWQPVDLNYDNQPYTQHYADYGYNNYGKQYAISGHTGDCIPCGYFAYALDTGDYLEDSCSLLEYTAYGTCSHCGDTIRYQDDARHNNNGDVFCEDCYDELYQYCNDCGVDVPAGDIVPVYGGQYTLYICEDCAGTTHYTCDDCGDYVHHDHAVHTEDGIICQSCFDSGDYQLCEYDDLVCTTARCYECDHPDCDYYEGEETTEESDESC
jgi:hypothetical protein